MLSFSKSSSVGSRPCTITATIPCAQTIGPEHGGERAEHLGVAERRLDLLDGVAEVLEQRGGRPGRGDDLGGRLDVGQRRRDRQADAQRLGLAGGRGG
jgi:hypothetical protein